MIFTQSFKTVTGSETSLPLVPEHWLCPLLGNTPIHYGKESISILPKILSEINPDAVAIIGDTQALKFHRETLQRHLPEHLNISWIEIESSESNKVWEQLHRICESLFNAGLSRASCVINFGGGVALNMGGLAASLSFRGLPFIQIPTTLLAESDVIISNKQSINFAGGKNRLGVYQPAKAVIIDPQWLATEPIRQKNAAVIEYAKNAIILGEHHYDLAYTHLQIDPTPFEAILEKSLYQKREIARRDPTEKGFGLALEYGHTFGHALEYILNGQIHHGEAVWYGMHIAGRIANKLGILSPTELAKQDELLSLCDPKASFKIPSRDELRELLGRDNKRQGDFAGFILLDRIGKIHTDPKQAGKLLTPVDTELAIDVASGALHALL